MQDSGRQGKKVAYRTRQWHTGLDSGRQGNGEEGSGRRGMAVARQRMPGDGRQGGDGRRGRDKKTDPVGGQFFVLCGRCLERVVCRGEGVTELDVSSGEAFLEPL